MLYFYPNKIYFIALIPLKYIVLHIFLTNRFIYFIVCFELILILIYFVPQRTR